MLTTNEKEIVVTILTQYSHLLLHKRCTSINGDEIQQYEEQYMELLNIIEKLNEDPRR